MFSGKLYTGVVSEILDSPAMDPGKIREVSGYETGLADILPEEMALWRWISQYYLCSIGEVYKNAYPAMKLKGEMVTARARERAENLKERELELKRGRLFRVQARLEAKKASLGTHKQGTKIAKALEESIVNLEKECRTLRGSIEEAGVVQASKAEESVPMIPAIRKKPELLCCSDRIPVYIDRIREEMRCGRTTLLLVPEIERSCRIQDILEDEFGKDVLVFHGGLAAGKKREAAARLRLSGKPYVVLGTRSALFLPLTRLGLIIIDEEQDHSYKQADFAPCYNGRDTAVSLAAITGANVLLGSSFPSLETILNSRTGKYTSLQSYSLQESAVEVIDTTLERKKHGMAGPLSFLLIKEMRFTLETGGGIVLLAASWLLDEVSAKIAELFPSPEGITVANIYTSKWLDIPGTRLVVVLSPDSMLSRPDIRADERVLQMLEMFRAKTSGGKFIVQTARSAHPVFSFESGRAERLLSERKDFGLPPYTRLVDISIVDGNENRKALMDRELARCLTGPWKRMQLPDRLRLILPKDRNLTSSKEAIRSMVLAFEKDRKYNGHIHIDVDPS